MHNLSKDKEEDLRKQYFCWWSKPLPEQHSFRRILCYEGGFGSNGSSPPKLVGAVFRCLIPILSGKGNTKGAVIMPLLASGDQVRSTLLCPFYAAFTPCSAANKASSNFSSLSNDFHKKVFVVSYSSRKFIFQSSLDFKQALTALKASTA